MSVFEQEIIEFRKLILLHIDNLNINNDIIKAKTISVINHLSDQNVDCLDSYDSIGTINIFNDGNSVNMIFLFFDNNDVLLTISEHSFDLLSNVSGIPYKKLNTVYVDKINDFLDTYDK